MRIDPSGSKRASCCRAKCVPRPISKLERSPPSRQATSPVALEIL